MPQLAILTPVLKRPHRVTPVLDTIWATVPDARVVFVCDPTDGPEMDAVEAEIERDRGEVLLMEHGGGYARKINAAVRATDEPLLFFGADDLEFTDGWFEAAKAKLDTQIGAVGVNDLIPRGTRQHATHFLVTREYAERGTVDRRPGPLCELYRHSFIDNEFIHTAKKRRAYAYAPDSIVRHLHPNVDLAPWDEVYGLGHVSMRPDHRIFTQRQNNWAWPLKRQS